MGISPTVRAGRAREVGVWRLGGQAGEGRRLSSGVGYSPDFALCSKCTGNAIIRKIKWE